MAKARKLAHPGKPAGEGILGEGEDLKVSDEIPKAAPFKGPLDDAISKAPLFKGLLVDAISKASLFKGLSAEQIEELARICLDRRYQKGEELFLEGSRAKGFYLAVSGKFKIYKLSPEGKEQILHIFGGGEIFGKSRRLQEEITRPAPRPSSPAGHCFFRGPPS